MSETWVSREELVEVMGDVGAVILCPQCVSCVSKAWS